MNAVTQHQSTGPHPTSGGGRSGAARVGVIGTYGHGNLGDEAVFVAFTQWVVENCPQVAPVALCVNPGYIERAYGVSAYPVAAHYARTGRPGGAGRSPAAAEPDRVSTDPGRRQTSLLGAVWRLIGPMRRFATHALGGLRRLLRPLLGPPWRTLKGFHLAARFLPHQLRIARSLDGVIVLGGGQIHDFWEGPFGHPVALWSWALASRMTGRPFAMLSIGAVELHHRLSRRFVRAALRWSVQATVRDRGSAAWVASLRMPRDFPICPDLAWGLELTRFIGRPGTSGQPRQATRNPSPRTVGVSLMAYRHPKLWARGEADAAGYERYIATMSAFCNRLLEQGYEVVLFPTQIRMDVAAARDVLERISPEYAARVRLWPVDGVPELVKCLASVDVVVASRFHGVLLALCAGCPVLSLAYQRKCNELLEQLDEAQFGLDIHDFSADELWERFARLCERFEAYAARLQSHVEENRGKLDAQYRSYFSRLG